MCVDDAHDNHDEEGDEDEDEDPNPRHCGDAQCVRHGTVGPASQALLEHAHRQAASWGAGDSADDGIKPTRLYSTNRDVDALNERELSQLPGASRTTIAGDLGCILPRVPARIVRAGARGVQL